MKSLINSNELFNVREFFEEIDNETVKARCKRCGKNLKCLGGSTSGLIRYLKGQHNIDKNNFQEFGMKLPKIR